MSNVKDLIVNSNARVLGSVITSKVVAPNNSDRSSTKYFATDGTIQNISGGGGSDISLSVTGSGNAVTGATKSGSTLTLTKGTKFMFVQGSTTNSAVLLGNGGTASGDYSVAEGYQTTASGLRSHAEGTNTQAIGAYSHAEGQNSVASSLGSHAEGVGATSSSEGSHAEGSRTTASGIASHAEGINTQAIGAYSHAEGSSTQATGRYSHAGGLGVVAGGTCTTAIGRYNNTTTGLFIVGNGSSTTSKSDALILTDAGALTVASNCNATAFYETSDIRKKNIVEDLSLSRCYDLIDKCQTIIYTLKEDPNNKKQLGLIAQEVNEIFPELITTDKDGMMTLDYSRITVICLRVLKELIIRIKKLEEK